MTLDLYEKKGCGTNLIIAKSPEKKGNLQKYFFITENIPLKLNDFRVHDNFKYRYLDLRLEGSLKNGGKRNVLEGNLHLIRCIPKEIEEMKNLFYCSVAYLFGKGDFVLLDEEDSDIFWCDTFNPKQNFGFIPLTLEQKAWMYFTPLNGNVKHINLGKIKLHKKTFHSSMNLAIDECEYERHPSIVLKGIR